MLSISMALFGGAFAAYTAASLLFWLWLTAGHWLRPRVGCAAAGAGGAAPAGLGVSATGAGATGAGLGAAARRPSGTVQWARRLLLLGLVAQGAATVLRWLAAGHAPISNMFEFMSFNAWCIVALYALLDRGGRTPILGAFTVPLGVIMLAYASVFPRDVQPLIPALQSYWLPLHVSLAAAGDAAFSVSAVAAFLYLLRVGARPDRPAESKALEAVFFFVCALVAFVLAVLAFRAAGFVVEAAGVNRPYALPPLVGPAATVAGDLGRWAGLPLPLATAPAWLGGVDAPRKLNTLVWALGGGLALYGLARLWLGRPLHAAAGRTVAGLDPIALDDAAYRAVAVGFPLFTLGGLIFAMIWAEKAWGSYWSWDPKETWALITWLFYAGYLHLRLQRGVEGRLSAWLLVGGFFVVLFTLVGVNLLIAGLHSYV